MYPQHWFKFPRKWETHITHGARFNQEVWRGTSFSLIKSFKCFVKKPFWRVLSRGGILHTLNVKKMKINIFRQLTFCGFCANFISNVPLLLSKLGWGAENLPNSAASEWRSDRWSFLFAQFMQKKQLMQKKSLCKKKLCKTNLKKKEVYAKKKVYAPPHWFQFAPHAANGFSEILSLGRISEYFPAASALVKDILVKTPQDSHEEFDFNIFLFKCSLHLSEVKECGRRVVSCWLQTWYLSKLLRDRCFGSKIFTQKTRESWHYSICDKRA